MQRRLISILILFFLPVPQFSDFSPSEAELRKSIKPLSLIPPFREMASVSDYRGTARRYRAGVVLAKFKGEHPRAIAVPIGQEREELERARAAYASSTARFQKFWDTQGPSD